MKIGFVPSLDLRQLGAEVGPVRLCLLENTVSRRTARTAVQRSVSYQQVSNYVFPFLMKRLDAQGNEIYARLNTWIKRKMTSFVSRDGFCKTERLWLEEGAFLCVY